MPSRGSKRVHIAQITLFMSAGIDVVVDHHHEAVGVGAGMALRGDQAGLLGMPAIHLLDRDGEPQPAAAGLVRPHALHLRHAGGFELVPDRAAAIGAAIEGVVVRRHAGIAPSRIGSLRCMKVSTRIAGSFLRPPA